MRQDSLFRSIEKSAVFSDCRQYRYLLSRSWEPSCGILNYLMLNPSTADETVNDPTIARQIERTRKLGYGGLVITNLFAWRSTDPSVLPAVADPIGPENDHYIEQAALSSQFVICGWGNHGSLNDRSKAVMKILESTQIPLKYLKLNGTGEPQHPLYIGYDRTPMEFHGSH